MFAFPLRKELLQVVLAFQVPVQEPVADGDGKDSFSGKALPPLWILHPADVWDDRTEHVYSLVFCMVGANGQAASALGCLTSCS